MTDKINKQLDIILKTNIILTRTDESMNNNATTEPSENPAKIAPKLNADVTFIEQLFS